MTTTLQTKVNKRDLKIYPSERLRQTDDGGGMPLGKPLTGALNELFQPISSIARVNGAFYAVLEYMGVLRPDNEPLIGAFAAITKPPSDPTVSYLMFKATRFGESRAEILSRIEAYNVATIESKMTLLSTQSKYSKVIQAYQRTDETLPMVGDVYCLKQNKSGYEKAEQYIQITRIVKAEERTFTNKSNGKEFKRMVVQMEISTPLKTDFYGTDYPDEAYIDNPCKIRETGVADAAQYYGVKPLAAAIVKETMQIKITSLMEKLVPTNQITTPLVDLTAAGQTQTLFDGSKADGAGVVTLAVSKNHTINSVSSVYFGNAVLPSSVVFNANGGNITDKGGKLYRGDKAVGSIDYANGFALINEPTFSDNIINVSFRPAAAELKVADTARILVDKNNVGSSFTYNIDPAPAVGTLQVSYRSKGKWYTLKDDGSGVLRGASAQHGSGNVNFATGSVVINLVELPDINSAILLAWGTRANYFNRTNSVAVNMAVTSAVYQPSINLGTGGLESNGNLANPITGSINMPILSSLVLSVVDSDNQTQTATTDRYGNVTGAFEGKFDGRNVTIQKINAKLSGNPQIAANFNIGTQTSKKDTATKQGTRVTVDWRGFSKGAWQFDWTSIQAGDITKTVNQHTYYDDGNGNLINKLKQVVGTVDYANFTATFDSALKESVMLPVYATSGLVLPNGLSGTHVQVQTLTGYTATMVDTVFSSGLITGYEVAEAKTTSISLTHCEIDLLPSFDEVITPSSVNFVLGGKRFFDKNGTVYTDLDPKTGSALAVGVINYQTGKLTFNDYSYNTLGTVTLASMVTSITGNPVQKVTFRTPKAPIRPGGITIRANALDGSKILLKSGYDGKLTDSNGSTSKGLVDYEYGVVDIWFDKPVFAETIMYNADAYTYLPIDSSVVKIDTVRLPQDGRVPIFRRGDSILIRNVKKDDLGSAFTGGQTIKLSRADVDRISLMDADNKPVLATLWDYDLDAGTITFKPSIDLSPYKMPLKATHAQEQRNRIVDLDIDGTLSLLFATNRNYPIENTYVSSLLIGDDLAVRVSVPFTQRSWNNVWQDTPVGEPLLNKLKLTDYPMVLTDDGAITDRWMIKFTSGSQFELYSEALGFVGKFDVLTNLAPINPATGKPYFTIDKRAFGTDTPWAAQDVIRFNTWGTLMPVWVLCAVQPNPNPPTGTDGFEQYLFGDTTEVIA